MVPVPQRFSLGRFEDGSGFCGSRFLARVGGFVSVGSVRAVSVRFRNFPV